MKKFNEVWTYISDLLNWRVNYPESITDVVSGTAHCQNTQIVF